MGGRGSSGGGKSSGGKSGGTSSSRIKIPSYTKAQVGKMSRKSLETLATAIFVNRSMGQGLSKSEAVNRAKSLMSGNTTSQLKNYVWKNRNS